MSWMSYTKVTTMRTCYTLLAGLYAAAAEVQGLTRTRPVRTDLKGHHAR